MDRHRPRHIRDIAHLYVSRMRKPEQGRRLRIVVAGGDRAFFPGFHAANLAVAFAASGCAVRLIEVSGVHPNAAYFLALPPDVYLDGPGREAAGAQVAPASALSGVDVVFALSPAPATGGSGDGGAAAKGPGARAVELVHVPPGEFEDSHRDAVAAATTAFEGDLATIAVAGPGRGRAMFRTPAPVAGRRYVLHVAGVPAAARASATTPASDLGTIDRWHGALNDPMPPQVRDPLSRLARAYRSVAEQLLVGERPDDGRSDEPSDRPEAGAYRKVTRRGASGAFARPR